ncbi:MAG: hypothetical protein EOM77_03280 [Bacteroidia bacterium]|nr:hypothetical protein [Bacteroidia bacterium]
MKKQYLILPLLMLALVSCKPSGDSSSDSLDNSSGDTSSDTSGDTSSGTGSSATDTSSGGVADGSTLLEYGYVTSVGWPVDYIGDFLSEYGHTEVVPSYETSRTVYYAEYIDEYDCPTLDLIILGDDDLHSAWGNVLTAASWDITTGSQDGTDFFYGYNSDETIYVQGAWFAADADYPAGTYFMISILEEKGGEIDDSSVYDTLDVAEGWPSAEIVSFFADYDNDTVVPGLVVEGETRYALVTDSAFYDPYMLIVLPGDSRVDEYVDILEAADYLIEEDEEQAGYYYATEANEMVLVEVAYFEAGDGFPAATFVFLTPTEVIEAPVGVDGVATFDLTNENALITKDGTQSVWSCSPVTMTIDKNDATVEVGNGSYFSNPLRVYAKQSVTFAADEGNTISSIELTFATAAYLAIANSAAAWSNVSTLEVSGTNNLVLIVTVLDPASPVTLTATAQTRLTNVIVNYDEVVA